MKIAKFLLKNLGNKKGGVTFRGKEAPYFQFQESLTNQNLNLYRDTVGYQMAYQSEQYQICRFRSEEK